SADKTVQLWDIASGQSKKTFQAVRPVTGLSVTKDGSRFAAASEKDVETWQIDGKVVSGISAKDVRGAALAPDGKKVAIATDNRVLVMTLDGFHLEHFPHAGVQAAAYLPDGKRLVSAGADKAARVWTAALLWQTPRGHGKVGHAVFSPKGDQV